VNSPKKRQRAKKAGEKKKKKIKTTQMKGEK